MRLSPKAMALSWGLMWGAAMFLVGLVHLWEPSYGGSLLSGMSTIYPGYGGAVSLSDAVLGGVYGFVDAGIGGLIFAWLYNAFAPKTA